MGFGFHPEAFEQQVDGDTTGLMLASSVGYQPGLNWLLEQDGIDVFTQNEFGDTGLIMGARKGWIHVVGEIVKKDSRAIRHVNVVNDKGQSALMVASWQGRAPVVNKLLNGITTKWIDVNIKASSHFGTF